MTVVFGIPVPSNDPVFLAIVGLHVIAGLIAVVSGVFAMRLPKGPGRHARAGTVYFWSIAALFASATALSAMRWANDFHLFALGALAFALALIARLAAHRYRRLRIHVLGMGASFITMLTAFYVDNGANLPLWRELPPIAYWITPSIVGIPIIAWAFLRHPLLRRATPQT